MSTPATASASAASDVAPGRINLDDDVLSVSSADGRDVQWLYDDPFEEALDEVLSEASQVGQMLAPVKPARLDAVLKAAAAAPALDPKSQWKVRKPGKSTGSNTKKTKGTKPKTRLTIWKGSRKANLCKKPAAAPTTASPPAELANEDVASGSSECLVQANHPAKFAEVPLGARPAAGQTTGQHSYTVTLGSASSISVRVRGFAAL